LTTCSDVAWLTPSWLSRAPLEALHSDCRAIRRPSKILLLTF
jgi:hypothetical protein